MAKQNLGMVTAYAYAVVGGYEGTEAEFEALLGNIATDLAEIENLTVIANTLPPGSSATASYDHGVLTLGIPKGDKGDTGAGATVTAGTTATGSPGTNASVTNSGTTKDAVFNFTIPRGDTGNGIESIYLTGTSGAVKTYTILFTDGNTTTFDVTDGEVTNAALTAVLADYAKIDGAYESMTVGNAEQLVSTVFINDEEPYNFRTAGGSADIGDREYDTIVGGTVAWNQLLSTSSGEQKKTIYSGMFSTDNVAIYNGHRYLVSFLQPAGCGVYRQNRTNFTVGYLNYSAPTVATLRQFIATATGTSTESFGGLVSKLETTEELYQLTKCMLIDLTAMFGSTIADYVYTLESGTSGAGVAWFRKLFPKPYYAYNAGELMSVKTSSHDTVGFNQWDEEWEQGRIDITTGEPAYSATRIRSKNYIPVVPNTAYYWKTGNQGLAICYYDADKNFISGAWEIENVVHTTPTNAHYIKFCTGDGNGGSYNVPICINLSWDGERDGEYEEYVKHSYPLDSDLVLRGIPKLDASNNLYYDGDTYESDGTVTRKYGIVDLGTLNWTTGTDSTGQYFKVTLSGAKSSVNSSRMPNLVCDKYIASPSNSVGEKNIAISSGETPTLFVRDTTYADAASFKTAMSGVYLVYELATPTTETADPFQSPQIVDDFGTEEYVDYALSEGDRDVAIPVGHITKYTNNLRAKLEMSPNSPDGAGDYLVRQTNGINEYVSLASNATIQDIIARLEALEGGGE